MPKRLRDEDLIGKRYGKLVVRDTWHVAGKTGKIRKCYVECDCGSPGRAVYYFNLCSGATSSCGCVNRERMRSSPPAITHGLSRHPDYNGIFARLRNEGLLAPEVSAIDKFISEFGPRPSKSAFLVRDDPTKPYGPGNGRWASRLENMCSKSKFKKIEHRGVAAPMATWADAIGVSRQGFKQWLDAKPRSASDLDAYIILHNPNLDFDKLEEILREIAERQNGNTGENTTPRT